MSRFSATWLGSARAAAGALAIAILSMLPAKAADLLEVRFGPNGDATRIVFDLQGAPEYSLAGDASGAGRLYVDFTKLGLRQGDTAYRPGQGHVAKYGFAFANGGVRAVMEFKKTAKVKDVFVLEPKDGVTKYRLVIDLETADKKAFLASIPTVYGDMTAMIEQATAPGAEAQVPATTGVTPPIAASVETTIAAAPPAPSLKTEGVDVAQLGIVRTIVIDAGHGGRDPGSQGQSGTLEKTVTLNAALELAKILEARGGYKVVLTRELDSDPKILNDQRKELARRETLARDAGAELFISLHADAINQDAVRGASVYTLSEEGTERSVALAKGQGNYTAYGLELDKNDQVLSDILLDKAQDHTITVSSKFAELLIENLNGKTPLLKHTHRQGDLRVLLAPDVPAVLLEMAFISNAKDESNLNSPVWRKRAMGAVADAIDQYFAGIPPQRQAQLATGAAR